MGVWYKYYTQDVKIELLSNKYSRYESLDMESILWNTRKFNCKTIDLFPMFFFNWKRRLLYTCCSRALCKVWDDKGTVTYKHKVFRGNFVSSIFQGRDCIIGFLVYYVLLPHQQNKNRSQINPGNCPLKLQALRLREWKNTWLDCLILSLRIAVVSMLENGDLSCRIYCISGSQISPMTLIYGTTKLYIAVLIPTDMIHRRWQPVNGKHAVLYKYLSIHLKSGHAMQKFFAFSGFIWNIPKSF